MRISTAHQFEASIANLQKRQVDMQTSQQQLTSGKRVEKASDDPTAASRAERARSSIEHIGASQRALDASRNSMTLGEGALGDAVDLLSQAREIMLKAGNGSYSDGERFALGNELKGIRTQLLALANRTDGNGGYLFAGQGTQGPPFIDQPGGATFIGVSGNIQTGANNDLPLTIDGRAAWEQARSGNGSFETRPGTNAVSGNPPAGWIDSGSVTDATALTGSTYQIQINGTGASATYTVTDVGNGSVVQAGPFAPGQSIAFAGIAVAISGAPVDGDRFEVRPSAASLKVFDVMDQAIAELNTPARSGAQINQSNASRVADLDALLSNMQNVRAQVGNVLQNLDGSEARMASVKVYNQATQSNAEDLDMVEGISNFQNQQTGYQAALQTYATVQRMSLLQYLT